MKSGTHEHSVMCLACHRAEDWEAEDTGPYNKNLNVAGSRAAWVTRQWLPLPHLDGDNCIWFGTTLNQTTECLMALCRYRGVLSTTSLTREIAGDRDA